MTPLTLSTAARLLAGELIGADAVITAVTTDSRRCPPGALFVALAGERFDGHDFVAAAKEQGAGAALVSRPVTVDLPQVQVADTLLALGRLAAAWRAQFNNPLIALTGSNGKTTVKEMLHAILRQRGPVLATEGNLNNAIGAPLTLLKLAPEHVFAVIEMGANHAGEIGYLTDLARPDAALINNAGPAHLEGFGDLDGVARAKGEIYRGLRPQGMAIINADDQYADYWRSLNSDRRVLDFGLTSAAKIRGRVLATTAAGQRCQIDYGEQSVTFELPLLGRHNVANALAATAASLAVGATLSEIGQGLARMSGVGGRLQRREGLHGSVLLDDTYNANPGSLIAALNALADLPAPHWLVLGDMAELGEETAALHAEAGRQARALGCQRLFALGEHSHHAAAAFGEGGVHHATLDALLAELHAALARARPTILVKGSRSMHMERVVQALAVLANTGREVV